MSNTTFTNRQLVVATSPDFMVQAAYDTAIATANLNSRHPQNTPAFHNNVMFRDQTRECTGRYVIQERITGKISRFTFAFDMSAKLGGGWYAYLQGIAAAPTGSPADESQTLNLHGATAGDFTLGLDFEGLSGTSVSIPASAALTAAAIQTALEAVRPIKAGNVLVTGSAGGPFTIAFQNALAKANIPLLTLVDSSTGGSGITIAAGTNGVNNLHAITRSSTDSPVLFSLIEGFDLETNGIKKYKNLVLDSWSVAITRKGKAILTVVAYGDPLPETLTGYSVPACVTVAPIYAKDCRLKIGSNYITSDLRELTYTESNNIDVSEDAIRFDDISPDQLRSGDPTASLSALFLGSPTVDLYVAADAEDNAFYATELALGVPGERLTIFNPNSQFSLQDNLIEFVGTRNTSAFRITARPSPDGSNIVSRGEYVGAFTGQFLLSS